MEISKEFIPYEQALALKELGFDEPCIRYYWTDGVFSKTYNEPFNFSKRHCEVSAPLYQQTFRWFREKCNLYACIERVEYIDSNEKGFQWYIFDKCSNVGEKLISYEEAELECLKKLIEIIKEKNQ